MRLWKQFGSLACSLLLACDCSAGETAEFQDRVVKSYWDVRGQVDQLDVSPLWSLDGKHIALVRTREGGERLDIYSVEKKEFISTDIWPKLEKAVREILPEGKKWRHGLRGISDFQVNPEGIILSFKKPLSGWWIYRDAALVQATGFTPPASDPSNGTVKLTAKKSGEVEVKGGVVSFTAPGKPAKQLGKAPEGGHYSGAPRWSPDGQGFILDFVRPGQNRQVTFVESSPKDQVQPKVHTFHYDKPGDKVTLTEPHVFFIDGRQPIFPKPELVQNPFWPQRAKWTQNGGRVEFEYVERGFGRKVIIGLDVETREQTILLEEKDERYIHNGFVAYRYDLPGTNELLWGSDRDGWRHLYLLDAKTYRVKSQLGEGNWHLREVLKVDEEKRQVIFLANGKETDQDPYHLHAYRVDFDGKNLIKLTEGDGTHEVILSPDGSRFIDKCSRVDAPPTWRLRSSLDGSLISELAACEIKSEFRLPERFHCKDRNGEFDIWGVIHYPANFDPSKKYPVLEQIYAGPHGAFVPKSFHPWHGAASEHADFGFVVVQIDGLGTAYRDPKFSKFAYKNLVDSGFPDRIKWMKEAAKTRPWMDVERVGIYGGSAGGQSTVAGLLHHGDFYLAGVADCGCHDNRMDKIWWNEQWMDWPVGPHYEQQSNVTNAHKLKGKLMLTVGELDRNVDPASTMQVADALIKADKDFELIILTGRGHGAGETSYARRRRLDFFKQHLGEPK